MILRWRQLLTCGLLLWQAGQVWGVDTPAASAAQRLEQVRLQMLERAMQASTRVDALSWVDAQGRLQEHQSLRQSVEVPPLKDSASPAATRDLVREARTDCRARRSPSDLRATLALRSHWPSRLVPSVRARLQDSVQGHWLGDSAQRPWRMFRAATPVPGQSDYERLLLSPPADHSPWTVELQLESLPPLRADTARMVWRLAVLQKEQLLMDQRVELELPQRQQPWGAEEWTEPAWQQVQQLLERWSRQLDQQFACVQPRAEVLAQQGSSWVLNMGSLAGLRVGDEWALADPAWLPERTLESGAIAQMVVARVVRVDAMRAELSLVAGEARQPRSGWVALPLNDPHAGLAAQLSPPPARR